MPHRAFLPEGHRFGGEDNTLFTSSRQGIEQAWLEGRIIEGRATLCDRAHNLHVELSDGIEGIIPHDETALGIAEGNVREIAVLSKVGKAVCFKVIAYADGKYILSRRAAQQEALNHIMAFSRLGDVIPVRVTHLENFGAFVDFGCGNISLIGIENISISRISHPSDRFAHRQDIFAVITGKDKAAGRINLSHRELLGTWEDNCQSFNCGMTVGGIVRGVEDYGVFVELSPNLSGLAEYRKDVHTGMPVSVYIKSIIPQRMKIKLIIIDALDCVGKSEIASSDYFIKEGNIQHWRYSPVECSSKIIESTFLPQ